VTVLQIAAPAHHITKFKADKIVMTVKSMQQLLEGKIAIVTGAARGIGKATAELLAEYGGRVLMTDIDGEALNEASACIREGGKEVVAFAGDVTNPEFPGKVISTTIEHFGGLDILINNAGYPWVNPVHEITDQQWRAILDCHLTAPFQIIRAASGFLLHLAKKEKEAGNIRARKIVNVSSVAGTRGLAGGANYAAAKAGVIGFTKSLAREWAPFNIQANAVAFGQISTRLTGPLEDGIKIQRENTEIPLGIPSQGRKFWSEMHPMGRPGTVEEAAGAILYFASPFSNYVSGQVLEVTGGV
jgi:3-oxoacyl-[acyl-carrier protein] reductase